MPRSLLFQLGTGHVHSYDSPTPNLKSTHVLIQAHRTLISSGTERQLLQFGESSYLEKLRSQPQHVKAVLEKVGTDGFASTLSTVSSKLSQYKPLGYCLVGTVLDVGSAVTNFKPGDRVACNGPHAEIAAVPESLCALIPDSVSFDDAVYTVPGSIALQGIRVSKPTFGESYLVIGLGLIGQLCVQLLRAHGCIVFAYDLDSSKMSTAAQQGASVIPENINPVEFLMACTDGHGVDSALIVTSTESQAPLDLATNACRKRGRIVLIGLSGLEIDRSKFYDKELTFQVSCSYGPGRYDPIYEQGCIDYPLHHVRWTLNRNFTSVLNAISSGLISPSVLASHRYPFAEYEAAYDLLLSSKPHTSIILDYSTGNSSSRPLSQTVHLTPLKPTKLPRTSFIGSGAFAQKTLIPAFKSCSQLNTLSSFSGASLAPVAAKHNFRAYTTDVNSVFEDDSSDVVVIASNHDSHAHLILKALESRKHVFAEKPLCLSMDELNTIMDVYTGESLLMVGYNRRFAPLIVSLKRYLESFISPKAFVYTCNTGYIEPAHWIHDPKIGGGRLIGEACHFVDLLRFLADSPIESTTLVAAADTKTCPDTFTIQLRFLNGSIGTVHYLSNGSRSFPKERIEVFSGGSVFRLDNFRSLRCWNSTSRTQRSFIQDKGHRACCNSFMNSVKHGYPSPIPSSELFEVQNAILSLI